MDRKKVMRDGGKVEEKDDADYDNDARDKMEHSYCSV
jgi:hypothetical protein